jgi:hypothetical protein
VVVATNPDPGKPLSAIVQTALSAATSPQVAGSLAILRDRRMARVIGLRHGYTPMRSARSQGRVGELPDGLVDREGTH